MGNPSPERGGWRVAPGGVLPAKLYPIRLGLRPSHLPRFGEGSLSHVRPGQRRVPTQARNGEGPQTSKLQGSPWERYCPSPKRGGWRVAPGGVLPRRLHPIRLGLQPSILPRFGEGSTRHIRPGQRCVPTLAPPGLSGAGGTGSCRTRATPFMCGVSFDRVQHLVHEPNGADRSPIRSHPACVPFRQALARAPLVQIRNGSAWTGAADCRIRSN